MNLRSIALLAILLVPALSFTEPGHHHHHHARPELEFLMKADRAEIIDAYFKKCDELQDLRKAYAYLKEHGIDRESYNWGVKTGVGLTVAGLGAVYAFYCYIRG